MEKTIKLGKKSVTLSSNAVWAMYYKNQFGYDIIPTVMPLLAAVSDVISGFFNNVEDPSKLSVKDVLKAIDGDSLSNAIIHLSGLEFTEFMNIAWALAKTAKEDTPDPMTWVREIDGFYVDILAPVVFDLIAAGLVSSKNLKWLKGITKKVTNQPLTSTTLSSQDLSGD